MKTRKNTIDRLGMRDEFSTWLEKEKNRISIGDTVELLDVGLVVDIPDHSRGKVFGFEYVGDDSMIKVDFPNIGRYTLHYREGRFRKIR